MLKNRYLLASFVIGGILTCLSGIQKAISQENTKDLCQSSRRQLKDAQKQLKNWEKEKAPLQKERTEVEKKFSIIQETLNSQTGCSEGNANNSSSCQQKLQEARQLGKRLNELDASIAQVNKKFRKIERDKNFSERKLEAYRCS